MTIPSSGAAVLGTQPDADAGPPAPGSLEETGLSSELVAGLLLKSLHAGEATGTLVARKLCLAFPVIEGLLEQARMERLVEVRGTTGLGTAAYRYGLTEAGRDRTRRLFESNQYVGPAPVPLAQYSAVIRRHATDRAAIDRRRLLAGFSDLVVDVSVIDQLGPAVNSGKAVFLYGPPGNGKTVMALGVSKALGGDAFVPFAIEVGGEIITCFDPVSHRPVGEAAESASLIARPGHDPRWQRVQRPVVVVGGELTLEMLDLSFNRISKFYEGPVQLKANGGVLVVDDFGRQRAPAADLLNRWIVPLESRVDYLTLHTGRKFEVPFDVLIMFATNLDPLSLADEAFLRRIPYKIAARNPSEDEYARIFELNCRRHGLGFERRYVEYLLDGFYRTERVPLRACHPRDLLDQVVNLCRYRGEPPNLTLEYLDAACESYFVRGVGALDRAPHAGGSGA